ncbi:hypothetical protein MHYP_G00170120 [Metynnis hypsauchen]
MTMETVTMQTALENSNSSDSKTDKTRPGGKQRLGEKGQQKPPGAQDPAIFEDISTPRVNMSTRPGQRRPTSKAKENRFFRPGSRPDAIQRPNGGLIPFNRTKIVKGGGRIGPYPMKKPTVRYPFQGTRAKKPSVEPGLKHPTSKYSKIPMVGNVTSQETGSKESIDETHFRKETAKHVNNGTGRSFLQYQPIVSGDKVVVERVPEPFQNVPDSSEQPLEPTITTERNLTAHINGTKCVRKVLVGHKKIHFNGTSNGKGIVKNMTVIVGHINGNDILHKIITSRSEGFANDVIPLTENGAKLQVTKQNIRARQMVPHDQVKPETITSSKNGSNLNLRPTSTVRGKNIRLPPKHTQLKPKATIIHGGPKGSKGSNVEKGFKPGLLVDSDASKDPKLGLSPDKDTSEESKDIKNKESEVALPTAKTPDKLKGTFLFSEGSDDGIDHVGLRNLTSKGFIIIWGAPKGLFQNFIISVSERGRGTAGQADQENKEEQDHKQDESDEEKEVGGDRSQEEGDEWKDEKKGSMNKGRTNVLAGAPDSHTVRRNSTDGGVVKKFTKVLPGSARSYPVSDLNPQTGYSVSLYGKGPGLRSNIHNFIISTGPEPPSNLAFSEVTESSLTVSWTRPKSQVSGFKVTYTHKQDGEPVSVTVDSTDSNLALSKLSPGSSYEVSVISMLGLDESDSISSTALTLPDPPTDLRAINVTDTKALLLWRPALATVDQYVIVYGSEEVPGSELTIKVSGNAAEQQLQALRASTKYTVTIVSQLGDRKSSGTTTIFTSSGSGGRGEGPRDLTASQVTARTAVLSWKPPASAVSSYKLKYFTEGRETKEVILGPHVTEYKVTGLHPSSTYTARLQGQRGGIYTAAISTEFTTGSLLFPFPSDCSQQLQNGRRESGVMEIFPEGKEGEPVRVYCDMETDGGGWTVFQRRKDGKTDFFRGWHEYIKGFGELDGEFWLGNELLHNLTTTTPMTLRVDLRSGDQSVYALYSTFSVDSMKRRYTIRVSGYSGTAGDSMTYHDRRPFSTRDRDPQPFITRCAMSYKGGWWYKNCHEANLNGLYNTHTNHQGVIWTAWKGKDFSIPFTEMKFRPASFDPRTQG